MEINAIMTYARPVSVKRGDPQLGPAQPGGRDHLHGTGDLANVLHTRDPVADVALGGHGVSLPPLGGRGLLRRVSGLGAGLVASRHDPLGVAGLDRLALLVEVVAEVVGELLDGRIDGGLGLV